MLPLTEIPYYRLRPFFYSLPTYPKHPIQSTALLMIPIIIIPLLTSFPAIQTPIWIATATSSVYRRILILNTSPEVHEITLNSMLPKLSGLFPSNVMYSLLVRPGPAGQHSVDSIALRLSIISVRSMPFIIPASFFYCAQSWLSISQQKLLYSCPPFLTVQSSNEKRLQMLQYGRGGCLRLRIGHSP